MDPALAVEVSTLARQRDLNDAIQNGGSDIQEFYKNATLFITGGSGFIGKQLIEKLFRSCDIKRIYMLLRPKKGKTIKERKETILKDPVFEAVSKMKPNFSDRLIPVQGDVTELRFGINDEDYARITEEVDVIIHVAATVNFEEPLKIATLTNVRGTREMLRLGEACKRIRSIVHVSTAFSHATISKVYSDVADDFYPTPIDPHLLIEMAESIENERLNSMTPHIIKDWPNTYTFTKATAEELVRNAPESLPICIVRPGIVICSYREPTPGWLDTSCAYGPSGLVLGSGLGLIHVLHGIDANRMDLVPVDVVNNATIAVAWQTALIPRRMIYTVTSTRNPLLFGEIYKYLLDVVKPQYPTPRAVFYPYVVSIENSVLFFLASLYCHFVPACILDLVCFVIGKPMRFRKIFNKGEKLLSVLSYFTLNTWDFHDQNLVDLYKSMSEEDRTIYNFDITNLDWTEQHILWAIGVRKYIIKDGLKDTEWALKKQSYFKYLSYFVVIVYSYLWYKVICFGLNFIGLVLGTFCSFV